LEPRSFGTLVRTHTTWGLGLLEVLGAPVTHPHSNLSVNAVEGNHWNCYIIVSRMKKGGVGYGYRRG